MLLTLYNLIHNTYLFTIQSYIGLIVSLILIIMFLLKRNRDERGWKIFGKASVISFIYFFIIVNIIANITGTMWQQQYVIDYLFYGHIVQFIYNSLIIVEIISVLILKRFE